MLSPLHFVNGGLTAVTVAPTPAVSGTSLAIPATVTLPPLPFLATICAAGEPVNQTNSEVVLFTAAGEGVLTMVRAVEGPMVARAIKVGDQVLLGSFTAGVMAALAPAPLTVSGTVYVSPTGDDANPGTSFSAPKRTLQAAHDALPETGETLANGKPVRSGRVIMGAATGGPGCPRFVVKSQHIREGLATFPGGKTYKATPGKSHPKGKRGRPYVQVNMAGAGQLTGSAADIGRILVNPEMPSKSMEMAEILDYWEGEIDETPSAEYPHGSGQRITKAGTGKTYFTISKLVGKTITELLYIEEPAIKISPGVSFEGQGQMAGVSGIGRRGTHGPTVIEDQGTGLTFYIESGQPKTPIEGRNTFSKFALRGKTRPAKKEAGFGEYRADMPIWGFYVQDTFGTTFEKLSITGYSGWGAYIGNNAGAEFMASLCMFTENGNVASKIGPGIDKQMTGNLSTEGGTPIQSLYNCLFLNGFGCCAALKGCHCVGNSFNHAQKSFFESGTKKLTGSGSNVLTGGDQTPTNIIGGWMEGGTVQVRSKGGYTTLVGIRFQGINGEQVGGEEEEEPEPWKSTEEYTEGDIVESVVGKPKGSGIWESIQSENINHKPEAGSLFWVELEAAEYSIEGGCTVLNCYFRHYAKACIKETGTQPIGWENCSCGGTGNEKIRGIPFVERSGGLPDVPLFAMYGEGRAGGKEEEGGEVVGAAVYSSPPFPPEHFPFPAGGYQNSEGFDVRLTIPVTYAAGGKLTETRSAGTAWTKVFPVEEHAAGTTMLLRLYLKAGEKVNLTGSGFTLGEVTQQWV